MNKTMTALAAFVLPLLAMAQSNADRLHLSQMSVNKGDSLITLNMTVNPKDFRLKGNDILSITPMLCTGTDTIEMPSVNVAGRKAWYNEIRNRKATPFTLSRAGKGKPVVYSATVPYDSRFRSSDIVIRTDTTNICRCFLQSGLTPVVEIQEDPRTDFIEYAHNFSYIAPKDTADKIFTLSGRANIIFKVNRTDIDWSYYSNHAELDTIIKTIDVVKDNEYATVERILLTGYASPEGPYSNNVRLAKGRTEVVTKYVEKHSGFPHSVYHTASVPEDWDGLRAWIVESSMPNKDAMIAFIDDPSIPIAKKNDMFMARFPNEYPYLLKNVYPVLRHTDYKITYKVKKFYDVDEIAKVFATNPKMLSLNELYLLSNKYEQGSPEYSEVFMAAALMYPESDVANLNAAGCELSNGNLDAAKTYLAKVKPGADRDYAWGLIYAIEGEYSKSLELLRKAADAGSKQAADLIPEVEDAMNPQNPIRML